MGMGWWVEGCERRVGGTREQRARDLQRKEGRVMSSSKQ